MGLPAEGAAAIALDAEDPDAALKPSVVKKLNARIGILEAENTRLRSTTTVNELRMRIQILETELKRSYAFNVRKKLQAVEKQFEELLVQEPAAQTIWTAVQSFMPASYLADISCSDSDSGDEDIQVDSVSIAANTPYRSFLSSRLEEMEEANAQLKQQVTALQTVVASHNKGRADLEGVLFASRKENSQLRAVITAADKTRIQLEATVNSHQKQCAELQAVVDSHKAGPAQHEAALELACAELRKERAELQASVERSTQRAAELQAAVDSSNKEITDLRDAIEHSKKEREALQAACNIARAEASKLEATVAAMQKENSDLQAIVASNKDRITQLESALDASKNEAVSPKSCMPVAPTPSTPVTSVAVCTPMTPMTDSSLGGDNYHAFAHTTPTHSTPAQQGDSVRFTGSARGRAGAISDGGFSAHVVHDGPKIADEHERELQWMQSTLAKRDTEVTRMHAELSLAMEEVLDLEHALDEKEHMLDVMHHELDAANEEVHELRGELEKKDATLKSALQDVEDMNERIARLKSSSESATALNHHKVEVVRLRTLVQDKEATIAKVREQLGAEHIRYERKLAELLHVLGDKEGHVQQLQAQVESLQTQLSSAGSVNGGVPVSWPSRANSMCDTGPVWGVTRSATVSMAGTEITELCRMGSVDSLGTTPPSGGEASEPRTPSKQWNRLRARLMQQSGSEEEYTVTHALEHLCPTLPSETHAKALRFLREVCGVHAEDRAKVCDAGAVPLLVSHLSSSSPDVQQGAASLLAVLANDENHTSTVTNAGAIIPLVKLLSQNMVHVESAAAAAVRALATTDENKTAIVNAGAVPPLVHLLGCGAAEAQLHAAHVMWMLACDSSEYQLAVARAGGISPLVRLLGSASADVQQWAVMTLCTLAAHDETLPAIACAGGISHLVRLLDSESGFVQQQAADTLSLLAATRDNQVKIAGVGAIPKLVKMLGPQNTACFVQMSAAAALKSLARMSTNRKALAASGALAHPLMQ